MSKASTSSIQHLLRQLYHAKNSVSNAIESTTSTASASSISGSSSSSTTVAAYSTAAARSLHHVTHSAGSGGGATSVNDFHTPPPASTASSSTSTSGEWATPSASTSNAGQHGLKHGRKLPPTTHHYHRHNANHHHVASSNITSSSNPFWSHQQPSSGSSSSGSNGGSSSGSIPPFTSNSSAAGGYAVTPSSSTSSSSSSSSSSILASSSSSTSNPQFSDATSHFNDTSPSSSSSSSSSNTSNSSSNALGSGTASESSSNKISQSSPHHHLTLHPGAYGIPKRLSSIAAAPSSSVKGKEREVHNDESIQSQIDQMRQSLLSVQVGEDAYFVRHDALGVADGVGGWSGRKGADPGLFAARLMHHCSAELALVEEQEQAARDADALASENQKPEEASSSSSSSAAASAAEDASQGMTSSSSSNQLGKTSKLAFVHSASATANKEKTSSNSTSTSASLSQGTHTNSESTKIDGASSENGTSTPGGQDQDQDQVTISPEHYKAKDTSLTAIKAGDPIEILHKAWDLTLSEFFDFELIGSSTALIALLKDDELRLANIGDCSCSIVRRRSPSSSLDENKEDGGMDGHGERGLNLVEDADYEGEYEGEYEYIFRSQEQQHSFNYPFQMGTNSKDTPRKDGQFFNVKIQKNDLIIISSDGLVDNLFDEDILEEIERQSHEFSSSSSQTQTQDFARQDSNQNNNNSKDQMGMTTEAFISPERLSKALCSRAKAVSEDQRAVTSPFQQKANEEGIHFVGGKHDDITVLVAVIGER